MVAIMFSLEVYLAERKQFIDKALDRRMPKATMRPAILHTAMRYSVFSGGKRLRPILCLAACEAAGGKMKDALVPACAIELLHTYTLIHDDLPALDDDDLRRGKTTSHKKFGEANAILAGDALLTLAFEWLADYPALAKELARAAGSQGTIAGQVEDLSAEGAKPDKKRLHYIHLHKTAKLIQAAVRMGAIVGKADEKDLTALSVYGEKSGLAFQLMDDVLDEEDGDQMSAVQVYGRAEALQRAQNLLTSAKESLEIITGETTALAAIADFIIQQAN